MTRRVRGYAEERNARPVEECVGLAIWFEQKRATRHDIFGVLGSSLIWAGYYNLNQCTWSGRSAHSQHPVWRFARGYMHYLMGDRTTKPRPSDITRRIGGQAVSVLSAADAAPVIAICEQVVAFQANREYAWRWRADRPALDFEPTPAGRHWAAQGALKYSLEDLDRAVRRGDEAGVQEAKEAVASARRALAAMQPARPLAPIFG